MLRLERNEPVDANLGGLLQEPFVAFVVLGGCYGHCQRVGERFEGIFRMKNLDPTTLRVVLDDASFVERTATIRQMNRITGLEAQHTYTVFRLLLAQRVVGRCNFGGIKELHDEFFRYLCQLARKACDKVK